MPSSRWRNVPHDARGLGNMTVWDLRELIEREVPAWFLLVLFAVLVVIEIIDIERHKK